MRAQRGPPGILHGHGGWTGLLHRRPHEGAQPPVSRGTNAEGTECGVNRYRYDRASSRCVAFSSYKGCGGTWNNFANSQQCEQFCQGR